MSFVRKLLAFCASIAHIIVFYAVVALLVVFGAMHAPKANAAPDIHVCATISANAGVVYDAVEALPNGADATPVAQSLIESKLPTGQVKILVQGLQFLLQNWGHPALTRDGFQRASVAVCVANFGTINDKDHV